MSGLNIKSGGKRFEVLLDVDRNNVKDVVIFKTTKGASIFRDCYVGNENSARCKKWFGPSWNMEIKAIQFMTKSGLNGKLCEFERGAYVVSGIYEIREILSGLFKEAMKLNSREVLSLIRTNERGGDIKGLALKYLRILRERSQNVNLSDSQIDILAELASNHYQDIIQSVTALIPMDAWIKGAGIFSYFEGNMDKFLALVSENVIFTNDELHKIRTNFGRIDNCLNNGGVSKQFKINYDPEATHTFHENGMLESGELLEETEIDGVVCKKGSYIELSDDGNLVFAHLAKDQEIRGLQLFEDQQVHFHSNGLLKEFVTKIYQPINFNYYWGKGFSSNKETIVIEKNTVVRFNSRGWPSKMTVGETYLLKTNRVPKDPEQTSGYTKIVQLDEPIPVKAGSVLTFHGESGAIASVELSKDSVIQGIPCSADRVVTFYGHGQLESVMFSRDVRIGSFDRAKGESKWFMEKDYLKWDTILGKVYY